MTTQPDSLGKDKQNIGNFALLVFLRVKMSKWLLKRTEFDINLIITNNNIILPRVRKTDVSFQI